MKCIIKDSVAQLASTKQYDLQKKIKGLFRATPFLKMATNNVYEVYNETLDLSACFKMQHELQNDQTLLQSHTIS